MKRGQSGLNFLLGIDKPTEMTSHDVVNCCRRSLHERRVGHMGTLDPLATGVMLVGVGKYTRLNQFLENHDKTYVVTASFGSATNTYDSEGEVAETSKVPLKFLDTCFAAEAVKSLEGRQMQRPPAFSAIKIDGQPAYKAARKGQDVEVPLREVEVYYAELLQVIGAKDGTGNAASKNATECVESKEPGNKNVENAQWVIKVSVSKGTYIRSLVHDLGQALGVPAHVVALRRTELGAVEIDECCPVEYLVDNNNQNDDDENAIDVSKINGVLDPVKVLGFEAVEADEKVLGAVKNGNAFSESDALQSEGSCWYEGQFISVVFKGELLAIYRYNDGRFVAVAVLANFA